MSAKYRVNAYSYEGFFGAYRAAGRFYQDKELKNGNEYIHELSFGSEYRGSSFMGQNILDAHFGLGVSSTVDSLTVSWPSGKVQLLSNLVADQRITVVEP